MAFYKNQSDMHAKRAAQSKKNGDQYYAKAMKAKEQGRKEEYEKYMAQAQHYYTAQKENEAKVKRDQGKNW